jgi:hypothetical protein
MRAAIDAVGVQSVESRVASEAVRLSERRRRSKFTSPDHGLRIGISRIPVLERLAEASWPSIEGEKSEDYGFFDS